MPRPTRQVKELRDKVDQLTERLRTYETIITGLRADLGGCGERLKRALNQAAELSQREEKTRDAIGRTLDRYNAACRLACALMTEDDDI